MKNLSLLLLLSAFLFVLSVRAGRIAPPASLAGSQPAEDGEQVWTDVTTEQMDVAALTAQGKIALNLEGMNWKHSQTDHFVFHYEQAIFARKVARMGEFFYDYISTDLKGLEDREKGRSHIFVFRNEKKWKEFLKNSPNVESWAFSYVLGPDMFLQQADISLSSGDILAHEMTHVIFNRFFTGRPPRWLNEGLAEYYGEFGYAAYKGIKKSKRAQFKLLPTAFPLQELLTATDYPADPKRVALFYRTSKFMVAFLLLDQPTEKFGPFLNKILGGTESIPALCDIYGYADQAALEKAFRAFSK